MSLLLPIHILLSIFSLKVGTVEIVAISAFLFPYFFKNELHSEKCVCKKPKQYEKGKGIKIKHQPVSNDPL